MTPVPPMSRNQVILKPYKHVLCPYPEEFVQAKCKGLPLRKFPPPRISEQCSSVWQNASLASLACRGLPESVSVVQPSQRS